MPRLICIHSTSLHPTHGISDKICNECHIPVMHKFPSLSDPFINNCKSVIADL